jgi:uncharacterized protein (TIGR03066 family)
MNTRCLLLPAIIVALFAASWSPAGDFPQAPPPHAKKTTAELLVGTWKVLKEDSRETPKDWTYEFTFTADGKFNVRLINPKRPPQVKFGTYKLTGNVIRCDIEADGNNAARKVDITIDSITEDTLSLTISAQSENPQNTFILQRRKSK